MRLLQINEGASRLRTVAAMDWIHFARLLALSAGAVAALILLVMGTLAWFLNHPAD